MKKHQGQTRCPICLKEFSDIHNMRVHMTTLHGMSKQEVNRVTNKRKTTMECVTQASDGDAP